MADPGKTREYSPTEKRTPAELGDFTTRDESELFDEDDMETSAGDVFGRENRVMEIRSKNALLNGESRELSRSRNSAAQLDSSEDAKAYNAVRPEMPDLNPESGQIRLFSEFEVTDFRSRWNDVQTGFVDSPRRAVEQADQLVATVMERITNSFAQERSSLEKQWDRGDHVSTEDLRVALQRYREFFGRLLNAA